MKTGSNSGGMKQDKFLTVFAVFDEATQKKLKGFQDSVLRLGCPGTQTMDIPFHISLGSFKVEDERDLKARIKAACSQQHAFEIRLNKVGHFNNRVLFVEPEENAPLRHLHDLFDGNFADGFPWHAHATIFCGEEEQAIKARQTKLRFKQFVKWQIATLLRCFSSSHKNTSSFCESPILRVVTNFFFKKCSSLHLFHKFR